MPPAHLSFPECFDVIATGTASVQNAFAQALSQVSRPSPAPHARAGVLYVRATVATSPRIETTRKKRSPIA